MMDLMLAKSEQWFKTYTNSCIQLHAHNKVHSTMIQSAQCLIVSLPRPCQ